MRDLLAHHIDANTNAQSVRDAMSQAIKNDAGYLHYVAGILLSDHVQPDLAREQWLRCFIPSNNDEYTRMLAAQELRKLGVEPPLVPPKPPRKKRAR